MLNQVGGVVLAISSDTPAESKKVVERYHIPFDILSDPGADYAKQCGLLFDDPFGRGAIALPANYLIDAEGRIYWRYISTHVQDRADPVHVRDNIQWMLGAPRDVPKKQPA